jgi:hypothetical protein
MSQTRLSFTERRPLNMQWALKWLTPLIQISNNDWAILYAPKMWWIILFYTNTIYRRKRFCLKIKINFSQKGRGQNDWPPSWRFLSIKWPKVEYLVPILLTCNDYIKLVTLHSGWMHLNLYLTRQVSKEQILIFNDGLGTVCFGCFWLFWA